MLKFVLFSRSTSCSIASGLNASTSSCSPSPSLCPCCWTSPSAPTTSTPPAHRHTDPLLRLLQGPAEGPDGLPAEGLQPALLLHALPHRSLTATCWTASATATASAASTTSASYSSSPQHSPNGGPVPSAPSFCPATTEEVLQLLSQVGVSVPSIHSFCFLAVCNPLLPSRSKKLMILSSFMFTCCRQWCVKFLHSW